MEAHLQTAPPHVTAALPSLLSHHTSVPLCSYNRRFPHNRLDPDVFTLLFQRKLRLPLLPATLSHTPCRFCHKPFDPYGDHLFQCFYNKKVLSDNIRDTLYTVCSHLAPMAGFVHSKHAVSCEPAGLLPDHPAKRPADVGLLIRPAALSNPPSTPVSTVAIDITVTSSPTTDPPARPTPQKPLTKAHLDSLRRKLSHSASVHNPAYFQNLLDNNILLLPFTIDPFGGLGYHAHRFLYGPTPPTSTAPPDPPPPTLTTHWQPHAQAMYTQLQAAPTGLLPKATAAYTPPPTATTGPPLSPQRWAHQCLALNISTALAQHLLRSLASATRSIHSPDTPTLTTIGLPFPHRTTTTFLDPLPYFLQTG